jgi:hypothetical protein
MSIRVSFTAIRTNARIKPEKQIRGDVEAFVARWAGRLLTKLVVYPPVPAGSTYARTGDLRRGWRLINTSRGDAVSFSLTNRVTSRYDGRPYAWWVQGTRQTSFHAAHGWVTVDTALKQMGGRESLRAGAQNVMNHATSEFRRG